MKRTIRHLLKTFAAGALLAGTGLNAATIDITTSAIDTEAAGNSGKVNWTSDNTYVLNGFVYVKAGIELHVQAGTVIKAKPGTGTGSSSLWITQGAKIFAIGTPEKPIIFTSEADDVFDPFDLGTNPTGATERWGGLVLLGNAVINSAANGTGNTSNPKYEVFEGLSDTQDNGQFVHRFGGNDDNDSSGVLRYVSIRYPGTVFSGASELNGLTMGGVGKGTILEYIEVFNSADDGFEWWGGCVNSKYLVAALCEDDSFDTDQGYRGKNQFWFAYQKNDGSLADQAMEIDGEVNAITGQTPESEWSVFNATFIGSGSDHGIHIRDGSVPSIFNTVFENFTHVAQVELDGSAKVANGRVKFQNNLFSNITTALGLNGEDDSQPYFAPLFVGGNNNVQADALLLNRNLTRSQDGSLDPRPASGSPALTAGNVQAPPNDGFFDQVDFLGAFPANDLWISRWTALDANLFITPNGGDPITPIGLTIDVTTATFSGAGDNKYFFFRTNTYVLNGFVYLHSGEELHIEPGTVIKAKPGTGTGSSSLWITKGAKIFARGTKHNPIIFTSEADDIRDPFDLGINPTGATERWGGLVLLGDAVINSAANGTGNTSNPKYEVFEGLGDTQDNGQFVHRFGGNNDNDSSGVLRYVSIRYPGTVFSGASELNGLTMGAVGKGTTLEFIEVFNSADDGFEWWGGCVNSCFLVAAFCEDDSFDTDQGYRGKNQFWFAYQKNDGSLADQAMEIDGEVNAITGQTPESEWSLFNATFIGSGADHGIHIRDGSVPSIFNTVFENFTHVAQVELDGSANVASGKVKFQNNLFSNITTALGLNGEDDSQPYFAPLFVGGNNNTTASALLGSINATRAQDETLDPRPGAGSPALDPANVQLPPNDGFFKRVPYLGAFGAENWAVNWTALAANCYMLNTAGAPLIADRPEPISANPGSTVVISAGVQGGALTYQWKKNGADLGGQTGPTLTLNNVSPSDFGTYTVTVSNSLGTITTAEITLNLVTGQTFGGLKLEGQVNQKFLIQSASDPAGPYTTIDTVTLTTPSMFYADLSNSVQGAGKRFYRAVPQ